MFDAAHPEFDLALEWITAEPVELVVAHAPAHAEPTLGSPAWLLSVLDVLPSKAARLFAEVAVPTVLMAARDAASRPEKHDHE